MLVFSKDIWDNISLILERGIQQGNINRKLREGNITDVPYYYFMAENFQTKFFEQC